MVVGIDKFRAYFAGHEEQYAIIGGAACDLLFNAAGVPFRATKDIDVVLCVEVVDAAFGASFKAFLDAGGYKARERSDGRKEFYRFHRPSDKSFPFMVELFARRPETLELPDDIGLTPFPVDDDVISLSAILPDSDYFEALNAAKRQLDGVTIVDETLLIPFKARAFLDLTERVAKGERIDAKNVKKHRNDVFRLLQLLPGDVNVDVPKPIRDDLRRFVAFVESDESFDLKSIGVRMTFSEGIAALRRAYALI